MTRINVVPVTELCDQHLLAEHRELKRIPNCVAMGKYNMVGIPDKYTLGTGHCKFFYSKLMYLKKRYIELHDECIRRGFNVQWMFPDDSELPDDPDMWHDYVPTANAMKINRERIGIRMPKNARYTGEKK